MLKPKKEFILKLFFIFLIFVITFLVSYIYGAWFGYPKGHDTAFHLLKTKFIIENWPNHYWWNTWAGGMPLFLYYPPLPQYLMAIIYLFSGISLELLLQFLSIFSIAFSALAIYFVVYKFSKNNFFSFISALLYIISPSSWVMSLIAGVYIRLFTFPFLLFGLYFSTNLFESFEKKHFDKKYLFLISLLIGLSILIHPFNGIIGLVFIFLYALFFVKKDLLFKLKELLKISLITLLISASAIIPLLIYFPKSSSSSWVSENAQESIYFNRLFFIPQNIYKLIESGSNYTDLNRLPFFLIPVLLLLLTCYLYLYRKNSNKNGLIKILKTKDCASYFLLFSLTLTCLWIIYTSGILLNLAKLFSVINSVYSLLATRGGMYFIPIFSSLSIGILLRLVYAKNKKLSYILSILTLFLSVAFLYDYFHGYRKDYVAEKLKVESNLSESELLTIRIRDFNYPYGEINDLIKNNYDKKYRYAVERIFMDNPLLFNYSYPTYAQADHYFSAGVINYDIFYFLSNLFWKSTDSDSTRFALDWWAVKNIIAKASNRKFSTNYTERTGTDKKASFYEYNDPSPVLSVSNKPVLLHIGNKQSYINTLFQLFTHANLNSNVILPVWGKENLEDYMYADLLNFDTIILYDYNLSSVSGISLLKDFVQNGGNLIIESNPIYELNQELPDPFPVLTISTSQRSGNWDFKSQSKNKYLINENITAFSTAGKNNSEWNISEAVAVKNWASVLLTSKGKPVLVEGTLGKGKVIWSGLNLPFHILNSKNQKELEFFKEFITSYFDESEDVKPEFEASFINPQKSTITLGKPANVVLFKESYFPNWKAWGITDSKKRRLEIFQTGPGYMLSFLPNNTQEVVFEYKRSAIEWISDLISIATFIWIIYNLVKLKRKN